MNIPSPTETSVKRRPPGALRAVQVLLYFFATVTVLQFNPERFAADAAGIVGMLVWLAPGAFCLVCAIRLPYGGEPWFWGIVALQSFIIMLTVAWIAGIWIYPAVPGVLTLPVLALLSLKPSRAHFYD